MRYGFKFVGIDGMREGERSEYHFDTLDEASNALRDFLNEDGGLNYGIDLDDFPGTPDDEENQNRYWFSFFHGETPSGHCEIYFYQIIDDCEYGMKNVLKDLRDEEIKTRSYPVLYSSNYLKSIICRENWNYLLENHPDLVFLEEE